MEIFELAVGVLSSVALFLLSVVMFSRSAKAIAGERIKRIIRSLTSTPFRSLAVGAVSTSILQSSSATSVLVASFADAGMIGLMSGIGLVIGVNIGTTITSQLVAFDLMSISPYIVLMGLALYWWGGEAKRISKPVIYFGLIFLSISLISVFVGQIDRSILQPFVFLSSNIFGAISIGVLSAIIFQSSSVVTGMVIILAGGGFLGLMPATGIILGANIGTTSTVLLASLSMGRDGKRVAIAHFLFNFIGVLIVLPVLGILYWAVGSMGGGLVRQIANIHLLFNLYVAAVFFVMIKPFTYIVRRILP